SDGAFTCCGVGTSSLLTSKSVQRAESKNHAPALSGFLMHRKLAAVYRSMLEEVAPKKLSGDFAAGLSKRMKETLQHLLAGDSEKEVAAKLSLSPHTVHV